MKQEAIRSTKPSRERNHHHTKCGKEQAIGAEERQQERYSVKQGDDERERIKLVSSKQG